MILEFFVVRLVNKILFIFFFCSFFMIFGFLFRLVKLYLFRSNMCVFIFIMFLNKGVCLENGIFVL